MGKKLAVGMQMEDFTYCTPWKKMQDFKEQSRDSRTCLMFLRYYGCSTCQLEIHELKEGYPEIQKKA